MLLYTSQMAWKRDGNENRAKWNAADPKKANGLWAYETPASSPFFQKKK